MYIPDMTERFPEGMNGVDLTDQYFPDEYYDGNMFEEDEVEEDLSDDE